MSHTQGIGGCKMPPYGALRGGKYGCKVPICARAARAALQNTLLSKHDLEVSTWSVPDEG